MLQIEKKYSSSSKICKRSHVDIFKIKKSAINDQNLIITNIAISVNKRALLVNKSALSVQTSALSVQICAFSVQKSAISVKKVAFQSVVKCPTEDCLKLEQFTPFLIAIIIF